jgi:uncharacterized protein with PQ loop repeat
VDIAILQGGYEIMEHFLLNVLPLLSGILLAFSYIPQIVETYKTKRVDGINRNFWIMITLALFGLTVSTGAVWYYKGTYGNFVVELFNVSLAAVMLVLVSTYRKRKETE